MGSIEGGNGRVNLTVLERLKLQDILPAQGNYINLRLIRELREELGFSKSEQQALNIVQSGDRITWDGEAGEKHIKGVEINGQMMEVIRDRLIHLDATGKLEAGQVSLYEKIVAMGAVDGE